MAYYITKASGQKELFDENKFRRSLQRVGASKKTVQQLLLEIKKLPKFTSTKEIYRWALSQLKKEERPVAARYNLKQALMQLGPSGYPFEQFMAQVFRAQGYEARTNQIIAGKCVEHEVDLIFFKGDSYNFAECKFHNRQGLKTPVKAILYVKARYDDVHAQWELQPQHHQQFHEAWVITNTRFTSEAIKYANCVGIRLLGWSYPKKNGLCELIDTLGIHPITSLTSLNAKQKRFLIERNFVLCRDVHKHINHLKELGVSENKLRKIIAEAEGVCAL